MNIRYGEIVTFYRVSAPSVAPTGTVVEGFTGLVLARNPKPRHQPAAALGEARLGGSAAADMQDRVPVRGICFNKGSETKKITEHNGFHSENYISFERREHTYLMRFANHLLTYRQVCANVPRK